MWRRTANKQVACNACGLYYKLYGVNRPIEMRKDIVYPRNRYSKMNGGQPKSTGGNGNSSGKQASPMDSVVNGGAFSIVRQQSPQQFQQQQLEVNKINTSPQTYLNAGTSSARNPPVTVLNAGTANGGTATKYVIITGGNGTGNGGTANLSNNSKALGTPARQNPLSAVDLHQGPKMNSSSSSQSNAKGAKGALFEVKREEEEDSVITEVKLEEEEDCSSDVERDISLASMEQACNPANLVSVQVKDETSEESSVSAQKCYFSSDFKTFCFYSAKTCHRLLLPLPLLFQAAHLFRDCLTCRRWRRRTLRKRRSFPQFCSPLERPFPLQWAETAMATARTPPPPLPVLPAS